MSDSRVKDNVLSRFIGRVMRLLSLYTGFTNPYSLRLKYFLKEIVPKHPEKLDLLLEYSRHEELRPSIYVRTGKHGRVEDVVVINQEKYDEKKKNLNLE